MTIQNSGEKGYDDSEFGGEGYDDSGERGFENSEFLGEEVTIQNSG